MRFAPSAHSGLSLIRDSQSAVISFSQTSGCLHEPPGVPARTKDPRQLVEGGGPYEQNKGALDEGAQRYAVRLVKEGSLLP